VAGAFQSAGLNTSVTVYDWDVGGQEEERYFATVRATNTGGLASVGRGETLLHFSA